MDSQSCSALNSWLQKADRNYLEGRLLWFQFCVEGAGNLLWLSCEQMIKMLLLQKEIDTLSAASSTLEELHKKLDEKGKNIGHDIGKLIEKVDDEYPDLQIGKFKFVLEKLQEYFYRRYVVNQGSSISLDMIDEVDEFYFLLRNKIDPDVGLGTIDEIFIQKKHNWKHPLRAFKYAYFMNKSFGPRRHKQINLRGPDGRSYREEGK